ncbi:hypothetical protein JCM10449v2_000306 [Rhodotorula kratochvilovae]
MERERSFSEGSLVQAPPARTASSLPPQLTLLGPPLTSSVNLHVLQIYGYAAAPPAEGASYPRSASQVFTGGSDGSYPSTPCNCAECFARPSSSSGVPQAYGELYTVPAPYVYSYAPAAGLPYPVDAYRPQQQASYPDQPVYRPIPRPADYATSSYPLPPAPLPSPPIEDQLPHLEPLPPYRSDWSPPNGSSSSSSLLLPDPPFLSRQSSYEQGAPYQPQTPVASPFLPAPISLPLNMDRRRSSGASLLETALSRRPSCLSLGSPYGSEYSIGSEEAFEERTTTPFMTKLHFLVHNPELAEVIRWNAEGNAIVFAHASTQLSEALARVFRHGNAHSFVRQLNIYDFKRLSSLELHTAVESLRRPESPLTSADFSGFSHPLFFRDSPGRACDLTRLKPKVGKKPSTKNLASAAKAAAVVAAAGGAGRPRNLRSDGKVGGGMQGRKV